MALQLELFQIGPESQAWDSVISAIGHKSVFERGDDEAEMHEHLENCRRITMHDSGRTQAKPEIRIWTASNDMAQSGRRKSSATEVPGRK
jgi:hypothetical protein